MNELLDEYYLLSDPDLEITPELQATLDALDEAIYNLRREEAIENERRKRTA